LQIEKTFYRSDGHDTCKMGVWTMAWKITVQATRQTEGKPQDMFLMVDGLKIARRGYPDTPEAGTWVPIEPGWEVKDVLGGDEIWVRYTNPVSGEVITFPEGGRQWPHTDMPASPQMDKRSMLRLPLQNGAGNDWRRSP
jgi:hypothetical protein